MKFWNSDMGFSGKNVPAAVTDIAGSLRDVLLEDGGFPRLLRIGLGDGSAEPCRYFVEVELAPGLVLPVEHGLEEDVDAGLEDEAEDVVNTVMAVCEDLVEVLPQVLELKELVHTARFEARRIVSEWNAQGVPTRLIDVQLAPLDHWQSRSQPSLSVLVEELDGCLQPAALPISVEEPQLIGEAMSEWRGRVARGYAQRAQFARKGASGTVTRLALNAMGHFGDVSEALRRFSSEWRFWLPDDTALLMTFGNVQAGSGDPAAKFDWWDKHVNVWALFTPLEELLTYVGQPVTALLDHEFLTDDMIVTGASISFQGDRPIVTINFTNPTLLFCSTTGRVWADGESAEESAPPADGPSESVVQFPRKARG